VTQRPCCRPPDARRSEQVDVELFEISRQAVRPTWPRARSRGAAGAERSELALDGARDPWHRVSSNNPERGVLIKDGGTMSTTGDDTP
jgi:hypothetical protein